MQIVPGSPEFTEQRAADTWILANGERDGQAYRTGRTGPVVKRVLLAGFGPDPPGEEPGNPQRSPHTQPQGAFK